MKYQAVFASGSTSYEQKKRSMGLKNSYLKQQQQQPNGFMLKNLINKNGSSQQQSITPKDVLDSIRNTKNTFTHTESKNNLNQISTQEENCNFRFTSNTEDPEVKKFIWANSNLRDGCIQEKGTMSSEKLKTPYNLNPKSKKQIEIKHQDSKSRDKSAPKIASPQLKNFQFLSIKESS